jgi:hypothetical protein
MSQTKVMQESKQAKVTFAGKLSHLYFSLPPLFALCAATVAWSQTVASFSGPHHRLPTLLWKKDSRGLRQSSLFNS